MGKTMVGGRLTTLKERVKNIRRPKKERSQKNLVGNSNPNAGSEDLETVLEKLGRVATKRGNVMEFYRVEEELGRGAFARVFRGIQRTTGKEVAMKIVSLRNIADKAVAEHKHKIERMKRRGKDTTEEEALTKADIELKAKKRVLAIMQSEIAVMQRVSKLPSRKTKNMVLLRDVLVNEKQVCVVMDLLTGGELFDRILSKKRYSEKDAAFHIRRIMRALRTLHANGIIHRDLKPENLVFESPEENSQIKLTDFGLACLQGVPDIHADAVVGSPGYIAPEVLERKEYTPACDVWSIGVILYILFVGGPPFHGKNDNETFRRIRAGKYGYPSNVKVSALAKDLVSKCLVVNPKDRITVSGFLSHPWLVQKAASADASIGVERLRAFNIQTKLKAVTTGVLWGAKSGLRRDLYRLLEGTPRESGLTGEELTLIRSALLKFRDNARTLTRQQFVHAMSGLGFTELPLEKIYGLFDPTGQERADIIEVIIGLSTAAKEWDGSSQIKFCFDTYDKDGTGKLSVSDITKVVRVVASEMETGLIHRLGSVFRAWSPQQEQVDIKDLEARLALAEGRSDARSLSDFDDDMPRTLSFRSASGKRAAFTENKHKSTASLVDGIQKVFHSFSSGFTKHDKALFFDRELSSGTTPGTDESGSEGEKATSRKNSKKSPKRTSTAAAKA
mmetsp:Transcript_8798/g.15465  ORF Transcript_8798/g.15465 Transcript_8798/m.15465 type:complete len:675 (+) Transcript_8798:221-2245(+)